MKSLVSKYWSDRPCNSWLADGAAPGTAEFFERTSAARYVREPFIPKFARFKEWCGKDVLEVGCGIGSDLAMFARYGARVVGVDLTRRGARLTLERLKCQGLGGVTAVADSESLPFASDMFDLVYSWGVIHHTPDTSAAAREIVRVAKPGGRIIVMIYNRRSLVALQAYLLYGLLKGHPFRSLSEIIASHLESPGTKAFTRTEALSMFSCLEGVRINSVMTIYDLRITRSRFLPNWVCSLLPQQLGYFMVVEGTKPAPPKGTCGEHKPNQQHQWHK